MNNRHQGSCLCGAVRFTVDGEFERFFLCHCTHCRKDTGSAYAANLFSSTAKLSWSSGEEQVRTFQLTGTRHARSFCANCGSALPCAANGFVAVPAGSLDTDPGVSPDARIFFASRAPWEHGLADLPVFDAFPQN
jgi:hypothetical protein